MILDITTEFTTISLFKDFSFSSRFKFTKFPTVYNYNLFLEVINKKLTEFIKKYGNPKTAAISLTGIVDYKRNVLQKSAYLHDYENQDIVGDIQQIIDCPVFLEQDCISDALAELNNLGKNIDEFGLITVTYGIGGVVIKKEKNKILVYPTELGHTIVVPNGRVCPCGQRGCVEAYIGGESLKDRFLKKPQDIKEINILEEAVDYLAIASTNFMMSFPLKNIIYSGSSISTLPFLKNKIKNQLEKRMKIYKQPKIRISSFSNKANTLGALKLIEINSNKNIQLFRIN